MALIGDLLLRIGADLVSWNALKGNLDKAQEQVKDFAENVGGLGETIGTAFEVGLAGALLHFGDQFEEATNAIISKTGAMGEELHGFQENFQNVFAQVDESSKDVADTMALLASRLSLVGQPLEELTIGMLDLAKVARESVVPLSDAVSKAFQAWKVSTEDQTESLNHLMRVAQASGASVTNLARDVQQFAPALRALGVGFNDAVLLLGQFNKAGIEVGAGMASLQKAILALGKAGVKDPIEGIRSLAAEIKHAASEGEAFQIAAKAFGKGSATIVDAIRSGKIDLENFSGSLKLSTNTVKQTAEQMLTIGDRLNQFWHQLKVAIAPAAESFVEATKNMLDRAKPLVDAVADLSKVFSELPGGMQLSATAVAGVALAIGPLSVAIKGVSLALTGLIGIISTSWKASAGFLAAELVEAQKAFFVFRTVIAGEGLAGALTAINASFLQLGTASKILAGGVGVVAAAFVGWKVGQWAYDNIPGVKAFGDALADLMMRFLGIGPLIDKWVESTNKTVQPTKDLAARVKEVEAELRAQGKTVEQGGRTLTQYASYLADVKKELGGYANAQADAKDKAEALRAKLLEQAEAAAAAAKKFAEWQDKFKEFVKGLGDLPRTMDEFRDAVLAGSLSVTGQLEQMRSKIVEASSNWAKMGAAGKQAFSDLVVAYTQFKREAEQFDFEKFLVSFRALDRDAGKIFDKLQGPLRDYINSLRHAADENKAALDKIELSGKGAVEMLKGLATATQQAEAAAKALSSTMSKASAEYASATKKAVDESIKDFDKFSEHGADLARRLSPQLFAIVENAKVAAEGMKAFGLTSTAAYDDVLKKAEAYYKAIIKGGADHREQLEAELGLINAQIQSNVAHGEAVGMLQKKYADVTDELKRLGFRLKETIDYGREFNAIFTKAWADFQQGLAQAIVAGKGFGSVFLSVIKQVETAVVQLLVKAFALDLKNALLGTAGQVSNLEKAFKGLGETIGKVFGSGGSKTAASGTSAGDSIKAAASGNAALGVIGIAVDAISAIVQGLQMARLETTMNAVELNTRKMDQTLEGPDGLLDHTRQIHFQVNDFLKSFNGWFHDAIASLMTTQEAALEALKLIGISVLAGGGGGGGDSDQVAALRQQLIDLTNAAGASDAIIATLERTIAESGQAASEATDQVGAYTNAFSDSSQAFDTATTDLASSAADLGTAAAGATGATKDLATQIAEITKKIEELVAAGKTNTQEYDDAKASLIDLSRQQDAQKRATEEASKASDGLTSAASDMASTVTVAGQAVNRFTSSVAGSVAQMAGAAAAVVLAAADTVEKAAETTQAVNGAKAAAAEVAPAPASVTLSGGGSTSGGAASAGPLVNVGGGHLVPSSQLSGDQIFSVTLSGNTILSSQDAMAVMNPAIDALRNQARLG